MHYVLRERPVPRVGPASRCRFGKARIFQQDGHGGVAFLGEDWAAFTPAGRRAEAVSSVWPSDVVVKRTIDQPRGDRSKTQATFATYDVIIKYEIENFKDSVRVALDIVESMSALRREILGDTGRDVEWETLVR